MRIKLLVLMLLILAMPTGYSYAWSNNDNSDRLSNDQAGVFLPGYLNAAKQQAYSIVNQNNQPKGWWKNLMDRIKDKTSNEIKEDATTKIQPEVKKKTSSASKEQTSSITTVITTSQIGNINIGSGTDKMYADAEGNIYSSPGDGRTLVSENIDGRAIVYGSDTYTGRFKANDGSVVGFLNLQNAIDYASTVSGTVLAQSGWYGSDIQLRSNVTICGGYNENGIRDIAGTPTYISARINSDGVTNVSIDGVSEAGRMDQNGRWSVLDTNSYGTISNSTNITFTNIDYLHSGRLFISDSNVNFDSSYNDIYYVNTSNSEINVTATAPVFYNELFIEEFSTNNNSTMSNALSSDYWRNISNSNIYGTYSSSPYEAFNKSFNPLAQGAISGIFKNLLDNKDTLTSNMTPGEGGGINKELIARLVNSLGAQTLAMPLTDQERADQMQVMALANILKNPTEDQKAVLDAVESLLNDMKNLQEKAGVNPELTKAESDLLQMVASVLLAQGVPDLLKAGDIEGVKGIFKDLGQSKDKIMMDYTQSIKPYYDNVVKELTANMAMLQLKGMLSKKITEEELKNLEPREIDRIIESIRKSNDKSFELSYILQQDAKYRKEYLDPQSKALEEAMKMMLNGFTKKINRVLEDKR